MPVYEYECATCGLFDRLRPVGESSLQSQCPHCGANADRIMSLPQLRAMQPLLRMAHERNEKSRHEPRVHSGSCGHQHGPAKSNVTADAGKRPVRQMYTGPRPWVIEHR